MAMARRSSRRVFAGAAPLIALATFLLGVPVVSAADQLQETGTSTYQLRPDRGVVHVTIQLTLTNRAPSTSRSWDCSYITHDAYGYTYLIKQRCTRRTDYYYNSYTFWVERDATAFKAKANAGKVSIKPSKRSGDWREVKLGISNLFYGKSRKITFSYDLPGGGPRSASERRVGYVYSNFCAVGPETDTGRLRVIVPRGYGMRVDETIRSVRSDATTTTYDSGNIKKDPWKFYPCFEGENTAGYAALPVTTSGGQTVTIESWKEDVTWAEAAKASVSEDLPALVTLLGDLPGGKDLTIHEQRAGRFQADPPGSGIHYLSEAVATRAGVTDDLVRLWIPRDAISTEWLAEGYAAWAQREAGVSEAPCDKPVVDAALKKELDLWTRLGDKPTQADRDRLAYQRQAACYLMSQVAAAIGSERVITTLAGIRDGVDPWRPQAAVRGTGPIGSRSWLDTITERGYVPADVDATPLYALLQEYGILETDGRVAARAETHAAYHELTRLMGDHAAPKAVTDPLARWDFDKARAAIAASTKAWQAAATVDEKLPSIAAGKSIQLAVSNATTQQDLDLAATQASTQATLATDLATAFALRDAPRDPLQGIGLLGATLPDATALSDAVARIDATTTRSGIDAINATMGTARDVGIQRALIVLAVVVVVLAAGWFVARRVRASRSRSEA
jgi:hypothetical protein